MTQLTDLLAGYKITTTSPTPAMCKAALSYASNGQSFSGIYINMLAAAPGLVLTETMLREDFEEWTKKIGQISLVHGDGTYFYANTEWMWRSYCSAFQIFDHAGWVRIQDK